MNDREIEGFFGGFGDRIAADADDTVVMTVLLILLGILLVAGIFGLVLYILRSIGLHRIGKNCGVSAAWLAWIPVAHYYVLGAVAERDTPAGKKPFPFGVVMVILAAVSTVFGGFGSYKLDMPQYLTDVIGQPLTLSISPLKALLSLVLIVFEFVALYRIFHLVDPGHATLYLVLSILFSGFMPAILLFAVRKRQPQYQPGYDIYGRPIPPYGQPPYGQPGWNANAPYAGQPNRYPYGTGAPGAYPPPPPYGQPPAYQPYAPQPPYGQPPYAPQQPMDQPPVRDDAPADGEQSDFPADDTPAYTAPPDPTDPADKNDDQFKL